jgi:hypothetical protein
MLAKCDNSRAISGSSINVLETRTCNIEVFISAHHTKSREILQPSHVLTYETGDIKTFTYLEIITTLLGNALSCAYPSCEMSINVKALEVSP